MANYVDYDYWVKGYGVGDLDQPDFYVVQGYWDAGYAEWEDVGSVASVNATATVTAKAVDFILATASVNGTATVTAFAVPDPYVVTGYWEGGYAEYDDISQNASVNVEAIVTANASKVFTFSGAITGNAALEVTVTNVQVATASVNASGTVSATGSFAVGGSASVSVTGSVSALGGFVASGRAVVNTSGSLNCIGNNIGYEWSPVAAGSNTWTPVTVSPDVWQQVSSSSNNWVNQ